MQKRPLVPYAILLAAVLVSALGVPRFSSPVNLGNVMAQAVPLMLTTAGQTIVLIAGGIDLSVGEVVTLTTIVVSSLMQPNATDMSLAVLAAVGIGAVIGAVNGVGVARLGLPPFLMTLAVMFGLQGVNLYFRPVPGGFVPPEFRVISTARLGVVPIAALVAVALIALTAIHIRRSRFGLHLYAVGGDERRARLSGISSISLKVYAYVLSSVFAVLAGLFLAARTGSADRSLGASYAFDSITAAVLGGASLFGGKGTLWGSMAAAMLLAVISNVLNLLHVMAYWQWIIKGILLVLAVAISTVREVRINGATAALPAD